MLNTGECISIWVMFKIKNINVIISIKAVLRPYLSLSMPVNTEQPVPIMNEKIIHFKLKIWPHFKIKLCMER